MTLLWPLLGWVALAAAVLNIGWFGFGAAVLLGAKLNARVRYLPFRVPMEEHHREAVMAMLIAADVRHIEALEDYRTYLELWRSGALMEPTGAFEVVTPATYTSKEMEPVT